MGADDDEPTGSFITPQIAQIVFDEAHRAGACQLSSGVRTEDGGWEGKLTITLPGANEIVVSADGGKLVYLLVHH